MDLDLDAILDTPVQTSLFIDCFDDLMDSLSSDFPLNGEFDSILADLHESGTTVMTPEPSPLPKEEGSAGANDSSNQTLLVENDVIREESTLNILQEELSSLTNNDYSEGLSSTSLEQFDAMMCLSGSSPPSEQYHSYEPVNLNLQTATCPPNIEDTSPRKPEDNILQQSDLQDRSNPTGVTQQTLVVQAEGQQFEIAISFALPCDLNAASEVRTEPASLTQQPLIAQTSPQVQWKLVQPTAETANLKQDHIKPAMPKTNAVVQHPVTLEVGKSDQANVLKHPKGTNFHDNYQNWLDRMKRFKQIQETLQPISHRPVTPAPKPSIDHIVVEDQSTTANPGQPTGNFVHVPSSYIINANGTHKAFVVHEVYKVANPSPEPLEELSAPNRKRPRKSNVVYDTDFLCVPCQKTFGKKGSLKQHIRSYHSEPLPWHCQTCGKKFATEQQLQRHVVNHDQRNKKFQCTECDKRYVHSKDRDRHFQTHHGVPTHGCGQCSMAFARRDHLLAHEMTHEKRLGSQMKIQQHGDVVSEE